MMVEGTRTIDTLPAGSIRNDTPIEIVSERWYSEELGMVVKTVHHDPLSGNSVYQLKNIRRGEPSSDLFQVSAGYALKESTIKLQTIKKQATTGPALDLAFGFGNREGLKTPFPGSPNAAIQLTCQHSVKLPDPVPQTAATSY
jgi:hypothetical protein